MGVWTVSVIVGRINRFVYFNCDIVKYGHTYIHIYILIIFVKAGRFVVTQRLVWTCQELKNYLNICTILHS